MAVPVHGLPCVLRRGLDVCVVPPLLKGSRWHTVLACEEGGGPGQLVLLSGVDSLEGARDLRGRFLLAAEKDLPEGLDAHDASRLLGREVRDPARGPIGTIEEVMAGPANDVWVVRGPFGEVLLPVVDHVVLDVSREGAISVDAEGFLGDGGRPA